uniref:Major facilitator superfamily (MFS) profile domain-containing protein n=1 Tax=Neolamprologus brichardi TaxID=32507 RepID=A0A3Q4GIK5_NEOBR
MRDYAETIGFLGQWGRFQQIVFFSLVATIMPNGFGAFTLVFLTDTPSHHCLVSGINLTEDWRKSVIPIRVSDCESPNSVIQCSRYRLDVVRNLSAQGYIPGRDVNLTDLEEEGCVDGWSYSKDIYESTIVSEFDLVCSNQWKQPFTSTVFFVGGLLGSFFSGQLSDRYGRKHILFAALAIQTVFTFAQVFSGSWIMFLIILFINGLGQMSNFVAALVLGSEVLTGKVRVLYSSFGTCLGFAIGYMILPLLAYFLRDWKSLSLALSLPCVAYVPFWWLMPESPRWLLSRGRVEEAEAIIRTAAKWNKVQAPRIIFEDCGVSELSLKHYWIKPRCRTQLFTMTVGYYSLSFNTAQFHENPYISCFISAVVEIPAYISSWMALLYLPRRLSVILTLVFGAVPLYLIQLVPDDLSNLALALEMLGKYSITTGSSLMFAYTAELYPTVLRNTATGTSNTVSRIGSCIAPLLLSLGMYSKYLPYIILGTLAVVAAFAALFLPESFKKPLPETIEQMHRRER